MTEQVDLANWPVLALAVWAELRFLPHLLDLIGWQRALGAKMGVTAEDAAKLRPRSLNLRGGAAILVIAAMLVGCGNPELRAATRELRKTWEAYVSSVAPVTSGDADLADAMNVGLESVEKAAD